MNRQYWNSSCRYLRLIDHRNPFGSLVTICIRKAVHGIIFHVVGYNNIEKATANINRFD
ncbi:hypothetical protein [Rhodococcus sp. OK302]|uniref:hypothetical protein n=1 Tax=Rhodococcus sp. OK302 TaxID=1882769 RepID=UPI00146CA06C|nr:hypothetical protein [Rhodococcus sp. OK302]